jgi:hypothetical protein
MTTPRYHDNAAECPLPAQGGHEPHYRQLLHLSMALSRLSLARHDEALDMLASTDTAADVSTDRGQREHNAHGT